MIGDGVNTEIGDPRLDSQAKLKGQVPRLPLTNDKVLSMTRTRWPAQQ